MAETDRIMFELREVAQELLKTQDIHEGLWGISIEFGLAAQNLQTGADNKNILPAGITLISKIGIQRWKEPNNLTIDAAVVNPTSLVRKREGGRKAPKKRARKR